MITVPVLLHGVGNVGRALLRLFDRQARLLAERHGLEIRVVGAVDSRGGVFVPEGIAPSTLLEARRSHATVAAARGGEWGMTALDCLARAAQPPTLLEATLVELGDGGVGLAAMRETLGRGGSVVSANKGPLVLAFAELEGLARAHGGGLAYSATVCGGLPAVNVGRYDLAHATILRMEGIVNSTTNYILTEMARGRAFDDALRQAQQDGVAEADPTLDVSGWDAANKLIILANSVLRQPASAGDVSVRGIEGISQEMLLDARNSGQVIKLVASAVYTKAGHYQLSVAPRALSLSHPLAPLHGHQMGLWLDTDINGTIFLSIVEETPEPTAAAMLRDLVLLAKGPRGW